MATPQRRAGIIFLKIGGVQYEAKGNYSYNLGTPKRDAIVGADSVHGYKEVPQVAFIEGEITDRADLDVKKLTELDGETVTLELANGKAVSLPGAWFAGDGNISTEEAAITVRFEGQQAEEI